MRSSTASSRCGEPACSTRGVCDEWAGTCDCPIGFSGARCEVPDLPACMLGEHAIPIRSWVLHAFHDNAGHWRSPPGTHGVRDLGPVPCGCLQQLVAAPFLLERTRLQYMRGLVVRCAELPPGVSLGAIVERPVPGVWRHFSFAAAYDALRLGVEPSLHGEPLDAEQPWLPGLLRAARDPATLQLAPTPRHVPAGEVEVGAGWLAKHLVADSIPPLLSRAAAATDSPPLLPLARCAARCGGVGWCEPTARGGGGVGDGGGGGRCGCFLPGGLVRGMGGEACGETRVWEVASQPVAHWGPPCHHVVDGQPHWNRRLWAGPERRHSSVVAACATRARSRLSHTFTRVYFRCHRVLPLVWRGRCLLFPHPAHPPCHVHFENRVASLFFTPPKSANCAEQLDPPSVAPRPEPRALALA